jgi:hypothetical protein
VLTKADMVERGVYRIHSRNLSVGVWDGVGGFIGIREKFGDEYLFREFHWENGPPYGTVKPLEFLTTLPEDIEIRENTDSFCHKCRQPVYHDSDKHQWFHTDNTQDGICLELRPCCATYQPLFDFLEPLDKEVSDLTSKEYDEKYGRYGGYVKKEEDADKA